MSHCVDCACAFHFQYLQGSVHIKVLHVFPFPLGVDVAGRLQQGPFCAGLWDQCGREHGHCAGACPPPTKAAVRRQDQCKVACANADVDRTLAHIAAHLV